MEIELKILENNNIGKSKKLICYVVNKKFNELFKHKKFYYVNIKPLNNQPSLDSRQYSPTNTYEDKGILFLEFNYRIYHDRHGISKYLSNLESRDSIICSEPLLDDWSNSLEDKALEKIMLTDNVIFCSGGAGITPFVQIAHQTLNKLYLNLNGVPKELNALVVNHSHDSIMCTDELNSLTNIFNNQSSIIFKKKDIIGSENFDESLILDLINNENYIIAIAGPNGFCNFIKGICDKNNLKYIIFWDNHEH